MKIALEKKMGKIHLFSLQNLFYMVQYNYIDKGGEQL